MVEIDMIRHNNQIDPHLAIWGWEIPVYLFLGGVAAGLMILTAAMRIRNEGQALSSWTRRMPFVAPLAISLGMLALFIDLANREHVWRFYAAFRVTSPMSWGAWILLAIYPLTVFLGLAGLTDSDLDRFIDWGPMRRLEKIVRWAHELARKFDRPIAWLNIVFGIGLGAYTGLLLGTLAARPAWSSVVLGPLFLVSGLSTGAALLMLFPLQEREHRVLRRWDIIAIVAEILLVALFFLGLATTGGASGARAIGLFFGGRFTAAFWTLVVLAGLVVPLTLEIVEAKRNLRPTLMAPVLILAGGLSLRWIVVLAGQA